MIEHVFAGNTWRRGLLLAAVVLAVLAPFLQQYTAPSASRYTLTAAMVDEGTVSLDDYEHGLDLDRAVHDGRTYSDKAPGQPVVAVPFYAAYRAVGGEPATVVRVRENLGLWWVTLWSSAVPVALLAALMWHHARSVDRRWAPVAAMAVALGTPLALYATHLYGHALAALLGYGGWLLAQQRPLTTRLALLAGMLLGTGIAVEYPVALIALVTGVGVLRRSIPRAWALVAGAVPPLALLLLYNAVTFDHPLRPGIATKSVISSNGFFGIGLPRLDNLSQMFFEERSTIIYMPLVVVVLVGAAYLLARRAGGWREIAVPLAMVGVFLLIPMGWANPWGGEEPVPRYIVPALPFLAAPAAWMLRQWPRLVAVAAGLGATVMGLAVMTFHMVPAGASPLARYVVQIGRGDLTPTVFTMALGPVGWGVHAALVAVAVAAAVRAFSGPADDRTARPAAAVGGGASP